MGLGVDVAAEAATYTTTVVSAASLHKVCTKTETYDMRFVRPPPPPDDVFFCIANVSRRPARRHVTLNVCQSSSVPCVQQIPSDSPAHAYVILMASPPPLSATKYLHDRFLFVRRLMTAAALFSVSWPNVRMYGQAGVNHRGSRGKGRPGSGAAAADGAGWLPRVHVPRQRHPGDQG